MPIYPDTWIYSTSIPGTGELPLYPIWFPALGIGDNRVYTPFIYVSSSHCLIAGYEDKIRTRSYLHFLIFLNFCIFVYIGLQPALYPHLFSLLLIGTSILIGHLFVLTNSRSSNLFFIIMLVGLFTLFGFNLWTLL